MSDVKYDAKKLAQDAQTFLDSFKEKMRKIQDETLGELYANVLPYIETDAWTNYREALRLDLAHEYKFKTFREPWAVNLRRAIFVENREELAKLINQDLLKRIKELEDRVKEFEQFRWTP